MDNQPLPSDLVQEFTVVKNMPLTIQLSKEGWAVVRRVLAAQDVGSLATPSHVVEAMMRNIVMDRVQGRDDAVAQCIGLHSYPRYPIWKTPHTLVSTSIVIEPSFLLLIFRRNTFIICKRVVERESGTIYGRPFNPATRALQLAFHNENSRSTDRSWLPPEGLSEWAARRLADSGDWMGVDLPLMKADIASGLMLRDSK